ncbi:uncharacterized protein LOC135503337 [Lineus longissimus]|uniref:uncharacterized protein LOC135503337 n=1 Tax=Lineus longissimus TaxID=88925 RepID=UPI002B4F45F4
MDFSTILEKLQNGIYKDVEAFHFDMLLIKSTYNSPADQVYADCETLFKYYEVEYGKLLKRLEKVKTAQNQKIWNIGSFMHAKKVAREDGTLKIVGDQINKMEATIMEKENRIHELNADIAWRERINCSFKNHTTTKESAVQVDVHLKPTQGAVPTIPTRVNQANSESVNIHPHTARQRIKKTIRAVQHIHGENRQSVVDGLWLTTVRTLTRKELEKYVGRSKKCRNLNLGRVTKPHDRFSKENIVRSVRNLYKGGLISSRKYSNIVKETSATSKPKLVPYKSLIAERKTIQSRLEVTRFSDGVDACYRNFETALFEVGAVYLKIDEHLMSMTGSGLNWFNRNRGQFSVALGADGAPSGKYGTSTSLLFSLLNVVDKVASCDHNYLLFGGNVKEDDESIMSYLRNLVPEIQKIEQNVYKIGDTDVTFSLDLIPGDNKWLASISGELSNAATYPCSFADVHKDELNKVDGIVGSEGYWKPWDYERRLALAKKVEKMKENNASRPIILKEMAKMKSRQEFVPVLGEYINKCMIDPLHMKNNMCRQMNALIVNEAIKRTDDSILKGGLQSPKFGTSPLGKYFHALKNNLKAGKLYIQMKRWFCENKASDFSKSCKIRFTGEESLKFCREFYHLIAACVQSDGQTPDFQSFRLLVLHQMCLVGRDAIALMSQMKFSMYDLQCLKEKCETYHRIHAMFLAHVSLTTWHAGYIVPYHAGLVYLKFGTGLGINTLQGREAKHKQIANYGKFSTPGNKWECIFRHEIAQLIWLPDNDALEEAKHIERSRRKKSKLHVYLEGSFKDDCSCRPSDDVDSPCKYCSHPWKNLIIDSCNNGKITPELKRVLEKFHAKLH